ncbi:hypothetical protein SRHO_G00294070 [Serrasalmus rhombeus]
MNVYEDAPSGSRMELEGVKTEDVYQTLHQPPPVKNSNPTHEPVRSCRIKTKLMVFNTLLLIVILILIGIFSAKKQQSADLNKPQASGGDSEREELWRLHRGVFYLFWEAEGNCTEALKFCEDRNSRMGTVTHENKDWILSQANGRKLWVKMDGATTGPLNKTLRQCPLDKGNSANSEEVQGWRTKKKTKHKTAPDAQVTERGKVSGVQQDIMTKMLVLKALLLTTTLIGLFSGTCQQAAEVKEPQAADESGELWRLHEGVSYLFGEAEGSCAEALDFCHQRGAAIAVITTKNKAWLESQADGRKLWMDMETAIPSVTVHQCPQRQSSDLAQANSVEKRGWVCERPEETPIIQRRYARAAPDNGTAPTSSAHCVHSVKMYMVIVSVLHLLRPLYS